MTLRLKRDGQYYYQMQQQIFVSGCHYCDFVVCAFNKNVMSDKSSDVICYSRKIIPNENTVVCNNPKCSFTKFHYSCLKISGSLPNLWYCPSCHFCYPNSKNLKTSKNTKAVNRDLQDQSYLSSFMGYMPSSVMPE